MIPDLQYISCVSSCKSVSVPGAMSSNKGYSVVLWPVSICSAIVKSEEKLYMWFTMHVIFQNMLFILAALDMINDQDDA